MAVLAAGVTGLPTERGDLAPTATAAERPEKAARTEQAAQSLAAETDNPVEILPLRTERGETFANPDGTFTSKEYVQPVRTLKDGSWTKLDSALVKQSNGTYAPKASTTAMSFSGGGDKPFASIERAGRMMSVSWPTRLPAPTVEGDTATYADVLADVDLVVRANDEGFAHVLVVKTAKAAANPKLAGIELPVKTDGVALKAQEGGGLVAEDTAGGGPVFEAPQPMMWDSGHTATASKSAFAADDAEAPIDGPVEGAKVAAVGLAATSGKLVLTPEADLLTGADTVYPVYIDPVTKTATRTGWTMVSSHFSSGEFWKFSGDEGIGRCPADVSYACASTDDRKRQFFAIPTASYEGKTIISAEFAVTMVHTYSSSGRSVELARVNSGSGSAISSGTNWSNQPSSKDYLGAQSPTNPAGSCTSTNQNVRFNVESTIQKAADSGWDATTFRLKAGSEDDYSYWKRFCGNAHVEVTYNRPPYQPTDPTMNFGGECEYGKAEEHYTDRPPTLSVTIRDPDHHDLGGSDVEMVRAQFRIYWPSDNPTTTHTVTKAFSSTGGSGAVGSQTFDWLAGSDITGDGVAAFTLPQNTTIGWEVRGGNDAAEADWGPWSNAGSATRCEFRYDSTKPSAPSVTSSRFEENVPTDGAGDYSTFTFQPADSAGADIVKYTYRFTGMATAKEISATAPGGAVSVRWFPPAEGSYVLTVNGVDPAGNTAKWPRSYRIRANPGRAPTAAWSLGDPAGAGQAAGSGSAAPATPGSGVTFGATGLGERPNEVGATLDGTGNGHLSTSAPSLDTSKTFAVAAWVYLPELPSRSMTIVSQDGTGEPGFTLGYDGEAKQWAFRTPVSEMETLGSWKVLGGDAVAKRWTHLIGVYDHDEGKMRLFVDGLLVDWDIQSRRTTWNARGGVQIGRHLSLAGYTAHLKGTVADVKLYDRVVSGDEAADLGEAVTDQLAYWPMSESANGLIPENSSGTGLNLAGNASIYLPDDSCEPSADPEAPPCPPVAQPLEGNGHLALDGSAGGYASRAGALLLEKGSFSLVTRAKLGSATPGGDQTVLSLPGAASRAAVVRYSQSANRWQLVLTDQDMATPVSTTLVGTGFEPSVDNPGDHLALVYDAVFGTVRLYVNGQLTGEAPWRNTWNFSTVGLDVGRNASGEYFSGAVDELRLYQGALDQPKVQLVAGLSESCDLGKECVIEAGTT